MTTLRITLDVDYLLDPDEEEEHGVRAMAEQMAEQFGVLHVTGRAGDIAVELVGCEAP